MYNYNYRSHKLMLVLPCFCWIGFAVSLIGKNKVANRLDCGFEYHITRVSSKPCNTPIV